MPKEVTLEWDEYAKLAKIDFAYVSGLEEEVQALRKLNEDLTTIRENLEMVIRDQRRELRETDKRNAEDTRELSRNYGKLKNENTSLNNRLAHVLADLAEAVADNERL